MKFKVDLGNVARVRGRTDEAVKWCCRAKMPNRNLWAGYPLAALALAFAQARDSRVSQTLADAQRFAPRPGESAPYGRWPSLNSLIKALATASKTEEAAALSPVAEEMLRLGFGIMWAGAALPMTTAGIAAACARDWARAEQHQDAIQQAGAMSLRVCQSIALYWYAEMLRSRGNSGDNAQAISQLRQSLSMFESLRASIYIRQANEALAFVKD